MRVRTGGDSPRPVSRASEARLTWWNSRTDGYERVCSQAAFESGWKEARASADGRRRRAPARDPGTRVSTDRDDGQMSAGTEAPQASVREEQAMLRALEIAAADGHHVLLMGPPATACCHGGGPRVPDLDHQRWPPTASKTGVRSAVCAPRKPA